MNTPVSATEEVVANHAAALDALPVLFARRAALEAELAQVSEEMDHHLGNLIVEHQHGGALGITKMASGAVIYWLPDPPAPVPADA